MEIQHNSEDWPSMHYDVSDGEASIRIELSEYPVTAEDEADLRARLVAALGLLLKDMRYT